mgnify:CR=1 FL=1
MNAFERVSAFLSHKEADRVPVYPILCGINRKLVGASYPVWSTDAETCANGFLKTLEEFPDLDCLVTLIDLSVECDAWGQKIIFPENEAAHPDYDNQVVQDIEDYAKIQKVDYRNSKRMMMHIDVIRRLAAKVKGKVPIVAFVFGPLGFLIEIAVFALGIAVTRCVSVGSIAAAAICPLLALYFYWGQWVPWLIIAATACVVIWAHRANIARLRAGTENKIGSKKTA